jgi:AcrR family transcriptional regulator
MSPPWLVDQTGARPTSFGGRFELPEETRVRIVEAAYRALARSGYEGTSVKDIAREAAVAPGLVHYYFSSKEELLVAAILRACERMRPPQGRTPVEEAREAFQTAADRLRAEPDLYRVLVDSFGVALHNPRVAEAMRGFVQSDRGHVERMAREVLAAREDRPLAEAPAIAAAVWGAILGIAVQSLVDPEVDAGAAVEALARMALE